MVRLFGCKSQRLSSFENWWMNAWIVAANLFDLKILCTEDRSTLQEFTWPWTSGHIKFSLAFFKSVPLIYPKTMIKANCRFFSILPHCTKLSYFTQLVLCSLWLTTTTLSESTLSSSSLTEIGWLKEIFLLLFVCMHFLFTYIVQ